MIRRGELRATKVGNRRYIEPDDLEAAIAARAGVASASDALDRIAALQAEVDQLREQLRADLPNRLAALGLKESLAILGRFRPDDFASRHAVREATDSVQRQLDAEVLPAFTGKRPKGVPDGAKRRTISTGIGSVDVWYWQTSRNTWKARFGGPRAGGVAGQALAYTAIRMAGVAARSVYGKPLRLSSARLRFLVLERDGFACHYCGRKAPDVELHVDHVVSIARGGTNDPDNLVTACRDCNLGKADA